MRRQLLHVAVIIVLPLVRPALNVLMVPVQDVVVIVIVGAQVQEGAVVVVRVVRATPKLSCGAMNIIEHPIQKLSLWGTLMVVVVLIGVLLFALSLKTNSHDESIRASLESTAASFAEGGAYDDTAVRNSLATLSPSDPNYLRAHLIYSSSQFQMNGREGQLEAVRSTKDRYRYSLEHGFLASQAYAINELVRYAVIAYDKKVTEEVFRDDFISLYDPSDIPTSLSRLSQKGIDVYPTSNGYLAYASSVATALTRNYLGTVKLEDAQKNDIVESVKDAIAKADALFERDATSEAYQFFGTHYPVTYYFVRGKLFGTLSLVDPAYLSEMEESFDAAVRASQGSDARLFIDGTLPYLYLARALVTLAVAPEREDVIRASAAAIANAVHADAEGTKFFLQYLRNSNHRPEIDELLTRQSAEALAAFDSGFKNLLISAGWRLGA